MILECDERSELEKGGGGEGCVGAVEWEWECEGSGGWVEYYCSVVKGDWLVEREEGGVVWCGGEGNKMSVRGKGREGWVAMGNGMDCNQCWAVGLLCWWRGM